MTVAHFGDKRLPPRFWAKVSPEPNSGCWLWTGAENGNGYGTIARGLRERLGGGRRHLVSAHRAAFHHLQRELKQDEVIDHLCRNTFCCNPAHLEAVTMAENTERGASKERRKAQVASLTHCKNGHPRTTENLREWRGHQICRPCEVEAQRRHRSKGE
jgi:HNH endonuclease